MTKTKHVRNGGHQPTSKIWAKVNAKTDAVWLRVKDRMMEQLHNHMTKGKTPEKWVPVFSKEDLKDLKENGVYLGSVEFGARDELRHLMANKATIQPKKAKIQPKKANNINRIEAILKKFKK